MRLLRIRRYAESASRTYAKGTNHIPMEVFRRKAVSSQGEYAEPEDIWAPEVAALVAACCLSLELGNLGVAYDATRHFLRATVYMFKSSLTTHRDEYFQTLGTNLADHRKSHETKKEWN